MIQPLFFSEQTFVKNEWGFKNDFFYRDVYEERNGYIKFLVCGFLLIENHFVIVLPKGVVETSNRLPLEDKAKLLLKVLFKYEKDAVKRQDIFFSNAFTNDRENIFSTIAEIIRDFMMNGILTVSYKKESINGSGKINWAKTIKRQQPFIQDSQFIYTEIITEQKLKSFSAEITELHWDILLEIEWHFGWLFNFKTHQTRKRYKPINSVKAKKVLKKAMAMTFNVREMKRYKLLYRYISKNYFSESTTLSNNKLLYAFKFEHVWETMGKVLLKHNEQISNSIPKFKWVKRIGEEYREQIPDIMVEHSNGRLFIVDAKYYAFDGKEDNRLPGGPDMGKQLLYLHSMSALNQYRDIFNLFIVPANLEEGIVNYYASGKLDHPALEKQFGEILTFQVDCLTMMEQYLNDTGIIYKELFNNIERYL